MDILINIGCGKTQRNIMYSSKFSPPPFKFPPPYILGMMYTAKQNKSQSFRFMYINIYVFPIKKTGLGIRFLI